MKRKITAWLIVSLVIGGFISLFASSHPDGFEKAGEESGYIEHSDAYLKSPLPDYRFPDATSWLSNSAAGIIGVILTFGFFVVLGRVIVRRKQ